MSDTTSDEKYLAPQDRGARTLRSVWDDLSQVDCNEHVEKKRVGQGVTLSYLSWAWAYGIMMRKYPDHVINWLHDEKDAATGVRYHADQTASVYVQVGIPVRPNDTKGMMLYREMWLPVMDNRNRAIENPDARAISDTKMRCLVKCYALFGLGHYIYAGEDLPGDPAREKAIEDNIAALKAHSRMLMQEYGGGVNSLPEGFVERGREAVGSRDLDALKKVVQEAKELIGRVRRMKDEADDVDTMDTDAEEE